jgi:hypothetical protein
LAVGTVADTSEEYLLSDVRSVVLDSSHIALGDHATGEVRLYTLGGAYEFTLKPIEPEEKFRDLCCLMFDSEHRLWVQDRRTRRATIFTLARGGPSSVRSIEMPLIPNGLQSHIWRDADGHLMYLSDQSVGAARHIQTVIAFVDTIGQLVRADTLLHSPGQGLNSVTALTADGRGSTVVTQPFGPTSLLALGPGGVSVKANSSSYDIVWSDSGGHVVRRIRRNIDSPIVSARERRSASRDLAQIRDRLRLPDTALAFRIPDAKPPLLGLGFDRDGRLWVERSVAEHGAHLADVYDSAGRFVGTFEWPAGVRIDISTATGNTALGVTSKVLGFERIVWLAFSPLAE